MECTFRLRSVILVPEAAPKLVHSPEEVGKDSDGELRECMMQHSFVVAVDVQG